MRDAILVTWLVCFVGIQGAGADSLRPLRVSEGTPIRKSFSLSGIEFVVPQHYEHTSAFTLVRLGPVETEPVQAILLSSRDPSIFLRLEIRDFQVTFTSPEGQREQVGVKRGGLRRRGRIYLARMVLFQEFSAALFDQDVQQILTQWSSVGGPGVQQGSATFPMGSVRVSIPEAWVHRLDPILYRPVHAVGQAALVLQDPHRPDHRVALTILALPQKLLFRIIHPDQGIVSRYVVPVTGKGFVSVNLMEEEIGWGLVRHLFGESPDDIYRYLTVLVETPGSVIKPDVPFGPVRLSLPGYKEYPWSLEQFSVGHGRRHYLALQFRTPASDPTKRRTTYLVFEVRELKQEELTQAGLDPGELTQTQQHLKTHPQDRLINVKVLGTSDRTIVFIPPGSEYRRISPFQWPSFQAFHAKVPKKWQVRYKERARSGPSVSTGRFDLAFAIGQPLTELSLPVMVRQFPHREPEETIYLLNPQDPEVEAFVEAYAGRLIDENVEVDFANLEQVIQRTVIKLKRRSPQYREEGSVDEIEVFWGTQPHPAFVLAVGPMGRARSVVFNLGWIIEQMSRGLFPVPIDVPGEVRRFIVPIEGKRVKVLYASFWDPVQGVVVVTRPPHLLPLAGRLIPEGPRSLEGHTAVLHHL